MGFLNNLWEDVKDKAGDALSWTGGKISNGASWAGNGIVNTAKKGVEKVSDALGENAIAKYGIAGGLVGVLGMLKGWSIKKTLFFSAIASFVTGKWLAPLFSKAKKGVTNLFNKEATQTAEAKTINLKTDYEKVKGQEYTDTPTPNVDATAQMSVMSADDTPDNLGVQFDDVNGEAKIVAIDAEKSGLSGTFDNNNKTTAEQTKTGEAVVIKLSTKPTQHSLAV